MELVLEKIAEDKGIPAAPLRAILTKLGEHGVPDDEIPTRLEVAANELVQFRVESKLLNVVRPEFAELREEAAVLIDQGELIAAGEMLNRGRQVARRSAREAVLSEAEFVADEGRIEHLQLNHQEAATKFAEAARLVRDVDRAAHIEFLLLQADALTEHGTQFVNNASLEAAIELLQTIVLEVSRSASPHEWAAVVFRLNIALLTLGRRDADMNRMEEAVLGFRSILQVLTFKQAPSEWTDCKGMLGLALCFVGERDATPHRLNEAIEVSRSALDQINPKKMPVKWAALKTNVALALMILGRRDGHARRLKEAAREFRKVLDTVGEHLTSSNRATLLNDLAYTLESLGSRELQLEPLAEAVRLFRESLSLTDKSRTPVRWADTMNNLGNALMSLGQRDENVSYLQEAVAAYQESLQGRPRELMPLAWAQAKNNLGCAYRLLGQFLSDISYYEAAAVAHNEALQEESRERAPLDWAMTKDNLGIALLQLGGLMGDDYYKHLVDALDCFETALQERPKDLVPLLWAQTTGNIGLVYIALGRREADVSKLERAKDCFIEALKVARRETNTYAYFAIQNGLGASLLQLAEIENRFERYLEASKSFWVALDLIGTGAAPNVIRPLARNAMLADARIASWPPRQTVIGGRQSINRPDRLLLRNALSRLRKIFAMFPSDPELSTIFAGALYFTVIDGAINAGADKCDAARAFSELVHIVQRFPPNAELTTVAIQASRASLESPLVDDQSQRHEAFEFLLSHVHKFGDDLDTRAKFAEALFRAVRIAKQSNNLTERDRLLNELIQLSKNWPSDSSIREQLMFALYNTWDDAASEGTPVRRERLFVHVQEIAENFIDDGVVQEVLTRFFLNMLNEALVREDSSETDVILDELRLLITAYPESVMLKCRLVMGLLNAQKIADKAGDALRRDTMLFEAGFLLENPDVSREMNSQDAIRRK
ncbi:MAG TPA: tetratricopeptide repeat protein [Rhizomicrobium sp.]|nr:tetratricopeptide repeat protein [Rhizomicrobium sp.]